jgi:hypothetical protein
VQAGRGAGAVPGAGEAEIREAMAGNLRRAQYDDRDKAASGARLVGVVAVVVVVDELPEGIAFSQVSCTTSSATEGDRTNVKAMRFIARSWRLTSSRKAISSPARSRARVSSSLATAAVTQPV